MAVLRALLLTDIVESTRLTEQLEEEAATALWSAHDRLARDLVLRWRGREIDKTDGMLVLFDTVSDALGYALEYHGALRARGLGIKARAGIHFGRVSLRANPSEDVARGAKAIEVDGIALPMVARVMSVAVGGQTLISDDARSALGVVPQRMQSHGHWLLYGIEQPIELFEIADGDTPMTAPPDAAKAHRVVRQGDLWQPMRELRHSLPAERDSFVGRHDSLELLARKFVAGARLVSVVGMGGMGKTRLVTRFAWSRRAEFPGGVWFCDLSQARELDGLLFAVAQGLEVPLGREDPVVQLGQAIAGRGKCLVVLDNFEQVAKFAEETLGQWLERAPLARLVTTTREVLGIVGEEIHAVPPLGADDSVELFLRRANAAREGYAPGPEDLDAIGKLVKVLDCLPLAIELAAARIRIMAPRALLARMNDRFDVLLSRAGRRDRQATLRAAFDWSWELLGESEKETLARMSVFEGGFTLLSAGAVACADPAAGQLPIVDLIQGLVDKSLVRQVGDDRFDMLESVRDYAAGHLRTVGRFDESGPACEAQTRARHWRHFAAFDEIAASADHCADLRNQIAACRAASAAGEGPSAIGCLLAAWSALRLTGPYRAAVELAVLVEQIRTLGDRDRGRVHWVAGSALDMLGDFEAARPHVEQGLEFAARADDLAFTVRLLIVRGNRQTLGGDLEAASASLDEAHRLSQALGDDALQASVLNAIGRLMDYQSRFAEARGLYEVALTLALARGDRRTEGALLGNLGGLHHVLGDLEEAREHYERALAIAHEVGDRRQEGNGRCNLGLLYQEQGRGTDARAQFELALSAAREIGHTRLAYTVLCNLGILLTAEGRVVEAAQHLDQAIKGAVASSDLHSEGQFRGFLALAQARQGLMHEARETIDHGESLLVASANRLSHALLLCDRAEIELLASRASAAKAAMQRARQIADELNCGPESDLRRRLAAIGAKLPVP
jgi:predicted ATPase/class 3 adenylate cyclase/tetratricopeptide (TPR) repeat protein